MTWLKCVSYQSTMTHIVQAFDLSAWFVGLAVTWCFCDVEKLEL